MLVKKYVWQFAETNQDSTFSHTSENSKMFNITSKYFSFFNNKPTARWVAHITKDFLTCYSRSYYRSMILPNHVADIYIKLKSITSKLHNTSASIAFIKKVLFIDVIPKFATVNGQFINEKNSLAASRKLMKSHLTKYVQDFTIY